SGSTVFKSTDGGSSWSRTGLPGAAAVAALALDALTPTTLYAGTQCDLFPLITITLCVGGVFKSTDGGSSWTAVKTGLTDTNVHALALDSHTPTTVYAGTASGGVFKSLDGGGSWRAMNTGLTDTNILALALTPLIPTTLYAGTEGGGIFAITVTLQQ